jgi:hypothetical protein
MKIINVEQGTYEWHQERLGRITGTSAKRAHGKEWKNLVYELIEDRNLGYIEDEPYENFDMMWGKEQEPVAANLYAAKFGVKLQEAGMLVNENHDIIAISPDRFYEDKNGIVGVEIKAPRTPKHLYCIDQNKIGYAKDYWESQCFHWFQIDPRVYRVDFISFDPRWEYRPMHVITIMRDSHLVKIKEEYDRLVMIENELSQIEARLKTT